MSNRSRPLGRGTGYGTSTAYHSAGSSHRGKYWFSSRVHSLKRNSLLLILSGCSACCAPSREDLANLSLGGRGRGVGKSSFDSTSHATSTGSRKETQVCKDI